MSADAINKEGLTFEEWVLAAGYAVFGYLHADGVFPYSTSSLERRELSPAQERNGSYAYLRRHGVVRRSRTHYPRKVRKAWLDGEDPTEWRAELENRRNDERRKEADLHARRQSLRGDAGG